MLDVSSEDITEGPLLQTLVALAAPLLVQNLVQVAQQVVDLFWVGRLGESQVAGVGFTFPVVGLITIALVGVFVGTQVVVSQRVGGDDEAGARRAAVQGVLLGVVSGLLLAGLVAWLAGPLVRTLTLGQLSAEVAGYAASYLAIWGFALVPAGVSDALEAGFVGWGDSRASLYINVTAVLGNIVLDPILIFGLWGAPALGVQGAALATVLGYVGGALLAVGLAAVGSRSFTLTRAAVQFDAQDAREVIDIGMPSAGEHAASQSVRVIIIALVAIVGAGPALAAYAIGARVASVAFIPATGLQQAAQSVVGQNLGAGNTARADRTTWYGAALAGGVLAAVGLLQWVVPGPLARLFVPEIGAAALELAKTYLQILAIGYPAIGATYLLLAGFNGAGETRTSFLIRTLQYWAVRLPIAAVGGVWLGLGVVAIFWAVTLSNVLAAVGAGAYYWYRTEDGMLRNAAETAA
ncbi:MAG: MATE family efflux transporter [Halobacteriaceae archaeon]